MMGTAGECDDAKICGKRGENAERIIIPCATPAPVIDPFQKVKVDKETVQELKKKSYRLAPS